MADADLINRFQTQQARILDAVVDAVTRLWNGLPSHHDDQVEPFATSIALILDPAALAMGRSVDAYIARMAGARPIGIPAATFTAVREGVDPLDLWRRPFLDTWKALDAGFPLDDAIARGVQRASAMAYTNTQMAMRAATAHATGAQPKVVGYRRTLTGKSCMFCAAASTRRYRDGDLMELHTKCDCGVAPIVGDRDPGAIVNRKLLNDLKSRGPDYWRQRGFVDADGQPVDPTAVPGGLARVEHHDELGPALITA